VYRKNKDRLALLVRIKIPTEVHEDKIIVACIARDLQEKVKRAQEKVRK
jgi:hypothetical protein